jgi:hypothetical protein
MISGIFLQFNTQKVYTEDIQFIVYIQSYWYFWPSFVTRVRTYKIAWTPQDQKIKGEEGASDR